MAWPSSAGLSKANFDAGTDSPASARSELEALYDHILLISNEVTDGATVWHSGNDGPNSGLNADLLDNEEGSFYRNASNLNAGTIPLAQIPTNLTGKNADQLDGQEGTHYLAFANFTGTASTAQIANDAITRDKIADGSIHTEQIDTSPNSTTVGAFGNVTLSGGKYCFWPQTKWNSGSSSAEVIVFNGSGTTLSTNVGNLGDATAAIESLYVNSSPPHQVNGVDYLDFIFLETDNNGDIVGAWLASDPPWYHNGPTSVIPNGPTIDGKKHRKVKIIPDEVKKLLDKSPKDCAKEIKKIKTSYQEITFDIKNADIDMFPHPFNSSKSNVCIIEPNQGGVYADICEIFRSGEDILKILLNGYLKVDNTEINTSGKPPGVPMHRIKWK